MSDTTVARQNDTTDEAPPRVPPDYLAEVDLEAARWSEIAGLIHLLTADERLAPATSAIPTGASRTSSPIWGLGWRKPRPSSRTLLLAPMSRTTSTLTRATQTCWPRRGISLGRRCGRTPPRLAPTCSSTGSRSARRVRRRTGGCGRPEPSTTASIFLRSVPGSPNWSRHGPARKATSGIHRRRKVVMATDTGFLGGWRYGLHPDAPGAVIGQMTRVSLPVGEALRLEMTNFGSSGVVHVQCYIATVSGALAVWTSCPPSQLSERLALLEAIEPAGSHDPVAPDAVVESR